MSRSHSAKPASISNSRWIGYVSAGLATAFAGSQVAEAEIHYSGPVQARFRGRETEEKTIPFLGQSALFFSRAIDQTGTHTFSYNGANAFFYISAQDGAVAGFYKTCVFNTSVASVSNLAQGDAVSQRPFVPNGGIMATVDPHGLGCGGAYRGQFLSRGPGFIGFKFDNGGGAQYGWARVKMGGARENRFEVLDYAFADPGEPIFAGQKRSDENRKPATGSLGLFALGAAGIVVWRRRAWFRGE